MTFKLKMPILGFEQIEEVNLTQIDDVIAKLEDVNNNHIVFSLINPYALREYSFDVSSNIQVMLDIKEDSQILVYNIVALQKPAEASVVNFLAPMIFNLTNMTAAQVVLQGSTYPQYGVAEQVKKYLAAS